MFYRAYSQHLATKNKSGSISNDAAASAAINAAGIPGLRYLDGSSRQADEGTRNYVIFDDSRVSVQSYEQSAGRGPRGSIQFAEDGKAVITLFETANLSTLQHELGHFFLTAMQEDARLGIGPAQVEYETIKGWWRENAKAVAADERSCEHVLRRLARDVERDDVAGGAFQP